MGRDTTASKRMAAKRGREKTAGLRRFNVAVKSEVLDRLTNLMKRHNCASQAAVIEFLIMTESAVTEDSSTIGMRNVVTNNARENALEAPAGKRQIPVQQQTNPAKPPHDRNKTSSAQMSLFDS